MSTDQSSPIQTLHAETTSKRQGLQSQLDDARQSIKRAGNPLELKSIMSEIDRLEREIAFFDNYENVLQEQAKAQAAELGQLREKYDELAKFIDAEHAKELSLTKELDSLLVQLAKKGRDLMKIRQGVVQRIQGSGLLDHKLLPSESAFLSRERDRFGRVAWDVKKFCDTYEVIRGRRDISVAPPEW